MLLYRIIYFFLSLHKTNDFATEPSHEWIIKQKKKCTGPERAAVGESYLSASPHRLVSFTSPRGLRASDEEFHLDPRNGHLRTETLPSNAARVRMCIGRGRLEIPTSPPPCASRGPVALPVVAVIERSLIKVRPVCLLWLVPSND